MTILHPDIERLALIGWCLYPATRSPRKAAMFKGASQAASCDLDVLEKWQHEYPNANWRVVCGPSKIWGVDIDVPGEEHKSDGVVSFKELQGDKAKLNCPTTRSGGGGYAVFFKHIGEPIYGKTNYPLPGLDPRRGALSVTVPPSIHHHTKNPYRWLVAPWEVNPAVAPEWMTQAFRQPDEPEFRRSPAITDDTKARRALVKAMQAIQDAPSGAANDTLNRRAYYVARCVAAGALSETEAVEALYAAALDRRIPRLEARDTIKSAFRSGLARPLERVS